MARVTYDKLFSESRKNVILLLSKSNVPDPISSSSEYRKWIYSSSPDVKSVGFSGYPLLIVNHADVDILDRSLLSGKTNNVEWNIEVEIVTSDRGNGNKAGMGAMQMDSISDNIMKTFCDVENRKVLSSQSMNFSRPITTAVTTDVVQNEKVFRRSILLSFSSKIKVSS